MFDMAGAQGESDNQKVVVLWRITSLCGQWCTTGASRLIWTVTPLDSLPKPPAVSTAVMIQRINHWCSIRQKVQGDPGRDAPILSTAAAQALIHLYLSAGKSCIVAMLLAWIQLLESLSNKIPNRSILSCKIGSQIGSPIRLWIGLPIASE